MRKLLLATVACTLLATQAQADKIDDSFAKVNGLWCYSSETKNLDPAPKGWKTTIYTKKGCTRKTGDWLFIDDNVTLSGDEYTCLTIEGGDNGWANVDANKGNKKIKRMVFSFSQKCNAEGYKWTRDARIMLGGSDNELFVGIKTTGKKK
jgi:hypothetical protein